MKRIRLREGDWFAVPLRTDGYAMGVVARLRKQSIVLGYFFGPRCTHIPTEVCVKELTPEKAVLVAKVGVVGLVQGHWPVILTPKTWDRQKWPLVAFARINLAGYAWRVEYSDNLEILSEESIDLDEARKMPSDTLLSYVSVEEKLTELLVH